MLQVSTSTPAVSAKEACAAGQPVNQGPKPHLCKGVPHARPGDAGGTRMCRGPCPSAGPEPRTARQEALPAGCWPGNPAAPARRSRGCRTGRGRWHQGKSRAGPGLSCDCSEPARASRSRVCSPPPWGHRKSVPEHPTQVPAVTPRVHCGDRGGPHARLGTRVAPATRTAPTLSRGNSAGEHSHVDGAGRPPRRARWTFPTPGRTVRRRHRSDQRTTTLSSTRPSPSLGPCRTKPSPTGVGDPSGST